MKHFKIMLTSKQDSCFCSISTFGKVMNLFLQARTRTRKISLKKFKIIIVIWFNFPNFITDDAQPWIITFLQSFCFARNFYSKIISGNKCGGTDKINKNHKRMRKKLGKKRVRDALSWWAYCIMKIIFKWLKQLLLCWQSYYLFLLGTLGLCVRSINGLCFIFWLNRSPES